jgi:hypothetical protein
MAEETMYDVFAYPIEARRTVWMRAGRMHGRLELRNRADFLHVHDLACIFEEVMYEDEGCLGLCGERRRQCANIAGKQEGTLFMGAHLEHLGGQRSYYTTISKHKTSFRLLCKQGNHTGMREVKTGR